MGERGSRSSMAESPPPLKVQSWCLGPVKTPARLSAAPGVAVPKKAEGG